ncbi:uncharacterized protein METZ01_LOCUS278782, partial [marine metagenome]
VEEILPAMYWHVMLKGRAPRCPESRMFQCGAAPVSGGSALFIICGCKSGWDDVFNTHARR